MGRTGRTMQGVQWIVDAHGCRPELLKSRSALSRLFRALVRELGLKPLGRPRFHVFPDPGGVTGLLMLQESHAACHSFPESGYCSIDLYCCRPRAEWPWRARLAELLGATRVEVRRVDRPRRPLGTP